jgi:hypothetical protein
MNRAQLFLQSLLQTGEQESEGPFSCVAGLAAGVWPTADKELRKSDMEAAVGAWALRTDLPDSITYIAGLRDEVRDVRPVPA